MTTDLDLTLREAGSDLHLGAPLADVLSRGDRIRRRRHRVRIIGAGTVLAAAAGVGTLALPPGTTPIPAAEAGWGPAMVNLSDADLAAADAQCRSFVDRMRSDVPATDTVPIPAEVAPLAADVHRTTIVIVYRFDTIVDTCSLTTTPDGPTVSFLMTGRPWAIGLEGGVHFEDLGGGGTYPPHSAQEILDGQIYDDPITDGVKILRVSDDVARLVLHIAGQDVEARVGDGLAVSWVPDGTLRSEIEHTTVTAYAADGSELETGPLYPGLP